MKLRCTHNAIRLRLRKSDIETLKTTNFVREQISFPDGTAFSFELNINAVCTEVMTGIRQGELDICLPVQIAKEWINTEQVGIEVHKALPNGETLHLLIEKDFPCQHRPEEDKADTFQELVPENPETDC